MVPKKIANRCHALSSTPGGIGRNQTTSAMSVVITPRNNRFLITLMPRDGVEFKALDYSMRHCSAVYDRAFFKISKKLAVIDRAYSCLTLAVGG
jgi:hypothetical protein